MEGLGTAPPRTEADLRAALAEQARRAPSADDVLSALRQAGSRRRHQPAWAAPAAAAPATASCGHRSTRARGARGDLIPAPRTAVSTAPALGARWASSARAALMSASVRAGASPRPVIIVPP